MNVKRVFVSGSISLLFLAPLVSSAQTIESTLSLLSSLSSILQSISSTLSALSSQQTAQVIDTSSPLSLTVTSPNGGETLFVGDTKTITWASSSVIDKVSIGWSTGPGSLNWIAYNIPNTNSYNWNVNVGNTTNTQFKIWMIGYQTGTGSVTDESDNFFSVYSVVNKTDLEIFKLCFGKYVTAGDSCFKSDFDASGFINFADLALLKSAQGDFNADLIIDLRDTADNADLNFMKSCFGQYTASSTSCAKADLNSDGFIDFLDLGKFKSSIKYDLNADSKVDLRENVGDNTTTTSSSLSLSASTETITKTPNISGTNDSATITEKNIFFERNLYRGLKGDDVTRLQELLAKDPQIYPSGQATGYYGYLTEAAVQNFQCKYGIVCNGDPESTGYGVVGPKTRLKLVEVYGAENANNSTQLSDTASNVVSVPQLPEGDREKMIEEYQQQISALLEQVKTLQLQLDALR